MFKFKNNWLSALCVMFGAFIFQATAFGASCNPITTSSHPDGLTYPAFNCFTDAVELSNRYGGSGDERDFVRVSVNNGTWGNNASAQPGDTVRVVFYMHNAGKYNTYPAAGTKLAMNWSDPSNITGVITANNSNPLLVDDNAMLSLSNGATLKPQRLRALHGANTENHDLTSWLRSDVNLTWPNFKSCFQFAQFYEINFVVEGPAIEIIKTDLNPADQDGANRNDTQTINR